MSAIDYTEPISEGEADEIFSELSGLPMAEPMIKTFRRGAHPDTYRLNDSYDATKIYGSPRNPHTGELEEEIEVSLRLENKDDRFDLRFFSVPLKQIPVTEEEDFAQVSSGPTSTGEWVYGKGEAMAYSIEGNMSSWFVLPQDSKITRWFFDLMGHLSLLSEEFCLDPSEQQKYWGGSTTEPS